MIQALLFLSMLAALPSSPLNPGPPPIPEPTRIQADGTKVWVLTPLIRMLRPTSDALERDTISTTDGGCPSFTTCVNVAQDSCDGNVVFAVYSETDTKQRCAFKCRGGDATYSETCEKDDYPMCPSCGWEDCHCWEACGDYLPPNCQPCPDPELCGVVE